MINLAPIRYARVLASSSGPVERIEYGRVVLGGRACYQANAYLSRHLNLTRHSARIFSMASGTGTDVSAMVARHKAISEALERWAYGYLFQTGNLSAHAFDIVPDTGGMAAFPGLFKAQARREALREAAERYCLATWWSGGLAARRVEALVTGCDGLEVENPLTRDHVVLLWRRTSGGHAGYGSAAGRTLQAALWKAGVELERSITALELFFRDNPGFGKEDLLTLDNPGERNLVRLALPEGHAEFLQRVLFGRATASARRPPKPLADAEIRGPWQRYATVWRVVYPRWRDGAEAVPAGPFLW